MSFLSAIREAIARRAIRVKVGIEVDVEAATASFRRGLC
jgi:hypothetical protein